MLVRDGVDGLQLEGAGWVASKEASIGRVVVKLEGVYSSGKNDFTNEVVLGKNVLYEGQHIRFG